MKKSTIPFFLCALSMAFTVESSAFKHVDCTLSPLHLRSKRVTHPHIPSASNDDSTNWSGYVVENNFASPETGSVSSVYGAWTVPKLTETDDDSYTAIWVGIDGFSDGSVEQLGTSHDWDNGAQVNYAWFEMYPNQSYELVGFPVDVGDVIGAEVAYIGGNVFKLSMINYTKNIHTTVPTSHTRSSSAKRSCAEWIVEAPYSSAILPLSDFGQVAFTNCTATVHSKSGPINDSSWESSSVTMVTDSGATKALPSALTPSGNGNGFTVKWEHE